MRHNLLVSWLSILVPAIPGAIAISAFYSGFKIHAVWAGFVTVIGVAFAIALQLDRIVRDNDQVDKHNIEEAKAIATRNSDDRPLLVFESVAANPNEWRAGFNAFQWSFRFRNYGKHAAKILSIKAFVTISDSVPAVDGKPRGTIPYGPRPFVENFDVGSLPIVAPGTQTQDFSLRGDHAPPRIDDQLPATVIEQRQYFSLFSVMPDAGPPVIGDKGIHFWLIGKIEYRDIFEGKTHTTQFGVYLTNPMHRLAEYPDPKYNFQD